MKRLALFRSILGIIIAVSLSWPVMAQQTTGTPGSPDATTTIDGKQLPPPDPKFGGVIKENASESRPGGRRASSRRRERPMCYSS